MGGIGSGGHNKTHKRVENYSRLDSFSFYNYVNGDKYLYYKDTVRYPHRGNDIIYHTKTRTASIDYDGTEYPLELSRVANIDGTTVRMYFLCPQCSKRVRFLYKKDDCYQCRKCANLNYASQQKSGSEKVIHRMKYIVEKKLDYTYWRTCCDMVYNLDYIPKPPYMRWEKYSRLIAEYRRLVEEYWSCELKSLSRYFDIKDIKQWI